MKMKAYKYFFILILVIGGCKDKSVEPSGTPLPDNYVVAYDTPGIGDIFLYNSLSNSVINITRNIGYQSYYAVVSSFSEDGHELLFTIVRDIFCYNLISGKIKRITKTEFEEAAPIFSKDGKHIVYQSWENQAWKIFMIDSSGNNKHLVTSEGSSTSPQFLMNDQKILYASYREGKTEFYINNINGSNEEQLTNDNLGSDFSISSTGNFFLFSSKEGISKYDFSSKSVTLVLGGNSGVKMNYAPIVSGDSKYIVYKYFDGSWIYNKIMTIDGTNLVDLGIGFTADFTKDSKNVVSLQRDGMHLYNLYSQKDSVLLPYQILSYGMVVSTIK